MNNNNILINGVTIKTPSKMKQTVSDLDGDSYRNASGTTIRDRIAVKRKLELSWNALTPAEAQALLSAVSDVFFTVSYTDIATNARTTKTFYVGDRNIEAYSLRENKEIYRNLTMNFIER